MAEEKRLLSAPGVADADDKVFLSLPAEVYQIRDRVINGVSGLNTSLRRVGPLGAPDGARDAHYQMELAARVRHSLVEPDARVIHYVLLSDHIKPNKRWRPDAIPPHVAQIVSNQIDDVTAVALTGISQGRMRFEREDDHTGRPKLRNGRLCFSCTTNIFDAIDTGVLHRSTSKVYLYWSGRGCWVISEQEGKPQPNVLRKPADRRFLWVKDPCVTPDLVDASWNKATQKNDAWEWGVCHDIRIKKSTGRSKFRAKLPSFTGRVEKKVEPDLEYCLISLNSKYLIVSWKDPRAESLISFRRLLLRTFGTYEKAWKLFTSAKSVNRNTCIEKLSNMFAETAYVVMNTKRLNDQPKWDEDAMLKFVQKYNTDAKVRALAEDIVHALGTHGGIEDGSLSMAEVERLWISQTAEPPRSPLEPSATMDYPNPPPEARPPEQPDMLAFREWLFAHPSYHMFERFWAGLTAGETIDWSDFLCVVKADDWQFIRDYLVAEGRSSKSHVEEVANQLFETLDAQNSGRVGLNELKPSTGDEFRDIDNIVLKFSIPLHQIGIFHIHRTACMKRLRICIKSQHEENEELFTAEKGSDNVEYTQGWAALRKALDLGKSSYGAYIDFSMSKHWFDLWDTVIEESDLRWPQEWVQNYKGHGGGSLSTMRREDRDVEHQREGQPERDMLVLGGTGPNRAMNGLYFNVARSGKSVWKMFKKDSGTMSLSTSYHQRYISKSDRPEGRIWFIGPDPFLGIHKDFQAGCALVKAAGGGDAAARDVGPHEVTSDWTIWSPTEASMVRREDLDEGADGEAKRSVDKITVQSIVGFMIRNDGLPDLNGRFFVRHSEFYDRPAYVSEALQPEETTLYLYWFQQEGVLKEGSFVGDGERIRDVVDASELFLQPGCWVVSSKLGAGPTSFKGDPDDMECVIAYVDDRAASPYDIAEGARWWIKDKTLGEVMDEGQPLQFVHQF